MSCASHSAGSSGRLAPKTGAGPTFQWAGKVDAICRSRSNRAKRPRAGCIFCSMIIAVIIIIMAWLRERRLRRGSSTSLAGTLVTDKADAGEACPVAVVAGDGLVWD